MKTLKSQKPNFKVKHPYGYIIKSILLGFVLLVSSFTGVLAGGLFAKPNDYVEAAVGDIAGTGTYLDPYIISNTAQFNTFAGWTASQTSGKYFLQTADIDNTFNMQINEFAGYYNGGGYYLTCYGDTIFLKNTGVISNLTLGYTAPSTDNCYYNYSPLCLLNEGTISNVKAISSYVSVKASAGTSGPDMLQPLDDYSHIGAYGTIAAVNASSGKIIDCGSQLSVKPIFYCDALFGGIVGYNAGGTIDGCFMTGSFDFSNLTSGYDGPKKVGGVVGASDGGTINNCYFRGAITSNTGGYQPSSMAAGICGIYCLPGSDIYDCAENMKYNVNSCIVLTNVNTSCFAGISPIANVSITNLVSEYPEFYDDGIQGNLTFCASNINFSSVFADASYTSSGAVSDSATQIHRDHTDAYDYDDIMLSQDTDRIEYFNMTKWAWVDRQFLNISNFPTVDWQTGDAGKEGLLLPRNMNMRDVNQEWGSETSWFGSFDIGMLSAASGTDYTASGTNYTVYTTAGFVYALKQAETTQGVTVTLANDINMWGLDWSAVSPGDDFTFNGSDDGETRYQLKYLYINSDNYFNGKSVQQYLIEDPTNGDDLGIGLFSNMASNGGVKYATLLAPTIVVNDLSAGWMGVGSIIGRSNGYSATLYCSYTLGANIILDNIYRSNLRYSLGSGYTDSSFGGLIGIVLDDTFITGSGIYSYDYFAEIMGMTIFGQDSFEEGDADISMSQGIEIISDVAVEGHINIGAAVGFSNSYTEIDCFTIDTGVEVINLNVEGLFHEEQGSDTLLNVGGVVGKIYICDFNMYDSHIDCSIYGSGENYLQGEYVKNYGGVAGYVDDVTKLYMYRCYVTTNIHMNGGQEAYAGGLVGYQGDTEMNTIIGSIISTYIYGASSASYDQAGIITGTGNGSDYYKFESCLINTQLPTSNLNGKYETMGEEISQDSTGVVINSVCAGISTSATYNERSGSIFALGTTNIGKLLGTSSSANPVYSTFYEDALFYDYIKVASTGSQVYNHTNSYVIIGGLYFAPYGLMSNIRWINIKNANDNITLAKNGVMNMANNTSYYVSTGDTILITNSNTSFTTKAGFSTSSTLSGGTSITSASYTFALPNDYQSKGYFVVTSSASELYFAVRLPDWVIENGGTAADFVTATNATYVGTLSGNTQYPYYKAAVGASVQVSMMGNTLNYTNGVFNYKLTTVYRGYTTHSASSGSVAQTTQITPTTADNSSTISFTASTSTCSTSTASGSIYGYKFNEERMAYVECQDGMVKFTTNAGSGTTQYNALWVVAGTQITPVPVTSQVPAGYSWVGFDYSTDEGGFWTDNSVADTDVIEVSASMISSGNDIWIRSRTSANSYTVTINYSVEGDEMATVSGGSAVLGDGWVKQGSTNKLSGSTSSITHGGSISLTVNPDNSKFKLGTYTASGATLSLSGTTLTVSGVTSSATVTLYFEQIQWTDSGVAASAYDSGSGTSASPYIIKTAAQFGKFINDANTDSGRAKYYSLGSDIDLAGKYISLITTEFTGTFNGNGYTISNLSFYQALNDGRIALFHTIGTTGVVKNIIFSGLDITGHRFVSPIAHINNGTISCLSITGSINKVSTSSVYGWDNGLLHSNYGLVEKCYVNSTKTLSHGFGWYNYAGGIIRNCYFGNTFAHSNSISNHGTIENVYKATGNSLVSNNGNGIAKNIYASNTPVYNNSTSGTVINATILTLDQMKVQSNFVGFDFASVWRMPASGETAYLGQPNNGTPQLYMWDTSSFKTVTVKYYVEGTEVTKNNNGGWSTDAESYSVASGQTFTFSVTASSPTTYLQRIVVGSTDIKTAANVISDGVRSTGYSSLTSPTISSSTTIYIYLVKPSLVATANNVTDTVAKEIFGSTYNSSAVVNVGANHSTKTLTVASAYGPIYIKEVIITAYNPLNGTTIVGSAQTIPVHFTTTAVTKTFNGTSVVVTPSTSSVGKALTIAVTGATEDISIQIVVMAKLTVTYSGNTSSQNITANYTSIYNSSGTKDSDNSLAIGSGTSIFLTPVNGSGSLVIPAATSGDSYKIINTITVNGSIKYTNSSNLRTAYTYSFNASDLIKYSTTSYINVNLNYKYSSYVYTFKLNGLYTSVNPTAVSVTGPELGTSTTKSFSSVATNQTVTFNVSYSSTPSFTFKYTTSGNIYRFIVSTGAANLSSATTDSSGDLAFTAEQSTAAKTYNVYLVQRYSTGIPYGSDLFTPLESIGFSGTQLINTGYLVKANTKIEVEFSTTSTAKWIFGARSSNGGTDSMGVFINNATNLWAQIGGNDGQYTVDDYVTGSPITKFTVDKDYIKINDKNVNSTARNKTIASGAYPVYIGSINTGGTIDSRKFTGKIYAFKIWEGDTLVMDMIPAVHVGGQVGLLDRVNDKFYVNEGTGTFAQETASSTSLSVQGVYNTNGFETSYADKARETYTITQNSSYKYVDSAYIDYNSQIQVVSNMNGTLTGYTACKVSDLYTFNGWYRGSSVLATVSNQYTVANATSTTCTISAVKANLPTIVPHYTLKTYQITTDITNQTDTSQNAFLDTYVGVVRSYNYASNAWSAWGVGNNSSKFRALASDGFSTMNGGNYYVRYDGISGGKRTYTVTACEKVAVHRNDDLTNGLGTGTFKHLISSVTVTGLNSNYAWDQSEYKSSSSVTTGILMGFGSGVVVASSSSTPIAVQFTYFPMVEVNLGETVNMQSLSGKKLFASGFGGTIAYTTSQNIASGWTASTSTSGNIFEATSSDNIDAGTNINYIRIQHTVPTSSLTGFTWKGFKIGSETNGRTSVTSGTEVGNIVLYSIASAVSGSNTVYTLIFAVSYTNANANITTQFYNVFEEKSYTLTVTNGGSSTLNESSGTEDSYLAFSTEKGKGAGSYTVYHYGYYQLKTTLSTPYTFTSTPYSISGSSFYTYSTSHGDVDSGNGYTSARSYARHFVINANTTITVNTTYYVKLNLQNTTSSFTTSGTTISTSDSGTLTRTHTVTSGVTSKTYTVKFAYTGISANANGEYWILKDGTLKITATYDSWAFTVANKYASTLEGTQSNLTSVSISDATFGDSKEISLFNSITEKTYTVTTSSGYIGTSANPSSGTSLTIGALGRAYIKAQSITGKEFSGWSGSNITINSAGSTSTYVTEPKAATTVTANYGSLYTLVIDTSVTNHITSGVSDNTSTISVSPAGGSSNYYNAGQVFTLSNSPATGHSFVKYQISTNGGSTWTDISGSSYTLTAVNTKIRGVFKENEYTLTFKKFNGSYTIDSNCSTGDKTGFASSADATYKVGYHTEITVTAVPTSPYRFNSWSINASTGWSTNGTVASKTGFTANHTITANTIVERTITVGYEIARYLTSDTVESQQTTLSSIVRVNENKVLFVYSTMILEVSGSSLVAGAVSGSGANSTITLKVGLSNATTLYVNGGKLYTDSAYKYEFTGTYTISGSTATINGTNYTISSNQVIFGGSIVNFKMYVANASVTGTNSKPNGTHTYFGMVYTHGTTTSVTATNSQLPNSAGKLTGSQVGSVFNFDFIANSTNLPANGTFVFRTIPYTDIIGKPGVGASGSEAVSTIKVVVNGKTQTITVKEGTSVTIKAEHQDAGSAAKGYKFTGWTFTPSNSSYSSNAGWMTTAGVNDDMTVTFAAWANRAGTYTANYTYAYKLKTATAVLDGSTFTANKGGTVTATGGDMYALDSTYLTGKQVTLTAKATTGTSDVFAFKGWYTLVGSTYTAISGATSTTYNVTSSSTWETTTYVAVFEYVYTVQLQTGSSALGAGTATYSATATSGKITGTTTSNGVVTYSVTKGTVLKITATVTGNTADTTKTYRLNSVKLGSSAYSTNVTYTTSGYDGAQISSFTVSSATNIFQFNYIQTFTVANPTSGTTNYTTGRSTSGVSSANVTVSSTATTLNSTTRYDKGGTATYTGVAATGYSGKWSITYTTSGQTYTATQTVNSNLTAPKFTATEKVYALTLAVTPSGAGTVSATVNNSYTDSNTSDSTYYVSHYGQATVSATENSGYKFVKWDAGNSTTSISGNVVSGLTANKDVTAIFKGVNLVGYNTYNQATGATGSPDVDVNYNFTTPLNVASNSTVTKGQTPVNLILMGVNTNGTMTIGKMRMYSARITEGDTLVRNYIPVKRSSDNKVGVLDILNNVFYTSPVGNLVAGASKGAYDSTYTLLDYVQTTGTQYIDTGMKATYQTSVDMVFMVDDITANAPLFGARKSMDEDYYVTWVIATSGKFRFDYFTTKTESVAISTGIKYNLIKNKANNSCFVCEDAQTVCSNITNTAKTSGQSPVNLTLMGLNTNGTMTVGQTRMYFARIYEDDTLLRDYIPVIRKSDGKVGALDKVNNVFYASAAGNFVAGRTIGDYNSSYTLLDYIKSTGTQYIDTGLKAKYNTTVDYVFAVDSFSGNVPLFGARTAYANNDYVCWVLNGSFRHDYFGTQADGGSLTLGVKYHVVKAKNVTNCTLSQSLAPGQSIEIESDSTVTLTANTAVEGFVFKGWALSTAPTTILATGSSYSFTLNSSSAGTYYAVYNPVYKFTVTANNWSGGSVTVTTPTVTETITANKTYSVEAGTSVTLTAANTSPYRWNKWSGASTSTNKTITATINADNTTYTANFVRTYNIKIYVKNASANLTGSFASNKFTVTNGTFGLGNSSSSSPNLTGTLSSDKTYVSYTVDAGTVVKLYAVASSGYKLVKIFTGTVSNWTTTAGTTVSNNSSQTINADIIYNAVIVPTVTVTTNNNISVTQTSFVKNGATSTTYTAGTASNVSTKEYQAGIALTLSVTPLAGYTTMTWMVNGSAYGSAVTISGTSAVTTTLTPTHGTAYTISVSYSGGLEYSYTQEGAGAFTAAGSTFSASSGKITPAAGATSVTFAIANKPVGWTSAKLYINGSSTASYTFNASNTSYAYTISAGANPTFKIVHTTTTWIDSGNYTTPGGSGTLASPYIIDSAGDLAWISYQSLINSKNFANTYFRQTVVNINLDGKLWVPIQNFNGVYFGATPIVSGTQGQHEVATITNVHTVNANKYITGYTQTASFASPTAFIVNANGAAFKNMDITVANDSYQSFGGGYYDTKDVDIYNATSVNGGRDGITENVPGIIGHVYTTLTATNVTSASYNVNSLQTLHNALTSATNGTLKTINLTGNVDGSYVYLPYHYTIPAGVTLNGNGYTISNITFVGVSGMFSSVAGTIKNLNLDHIYVDDGFGEYDNYGVIAGEVSGTIENVNALALGNVYRVTGIDCTNKNYGGFFGNITGTVRRSHLINDDNLEFYDNNQTNCNLIVGSIAGSISGTLSEVGAESITYILNAENIQTGGIAGKILSGANINDCYVLGWYTYNYYPIAVLATGGSITNAYSAMRPDGENKSSVMYAQTTGATFTNVYVSDISTTATGANVKTDADMRALSKRDSVYAGFDFVSTWVRGTDGEYPTLGSRKLTIELISGVALITIASSTYTYADEFELDTDTQVFGITAGDTVNVTITLDNYPYRTISSVLYDGTEIGNNKNQTYTAFRLQTAKKNSIVMDTEHSIVVDTENITYPVKVTTESVNSGTGTVTGAGEYTNGQSVTLSATPTATSDYVGNKFNGWKHYEQVITGTSDIVSGNISSHNTIKGQQVTVDINNYYYSSIYLTSSKFAKNTTYKVSHDIVSNTNASARYSTLVFFYTDGSTSEINSSTYGTSTSVSFNITSKDKDISQVELRFSRGANNAGASTVVVDNILVEKVTSSYDSTSASRSITVSDTTKGMYTATFARTFTYTSNGTPATYTGEPQTSQTITFTIPTGQQIESITRKNGDGTVTVYSRNNGATGGYTLSGNKLTFNLSNTTRGAYTATFSTTSHGVTVTANNFGNDKQIHTGNDKVEIYNGSTLVATLSGDTLSTKVQVPYGATVKVVAYSKLAYKVKTINGATATNTTYTSGGYTRYKAEYTVSGTISGDVTIPVVYEGDYWIGYSFTEHTSAVGHSAEFITANGGTAANENTTSTSTITFSNSASLYNMGTRYRPFVISTAAQLARVAYLVNTNASYTYYDGGKYTNVTYRSAYYKITADIDLGQYLWVPISLLGRASSNYRFSGEIGADTNKTISNMTIFFDSAECKSGVATINPDLGFIGGATTSIMTNLTFENPDVRTYATIGGFSGIVYGYTNWSYAIMNNVHVNNGYIVGNNASGFVGHAGLFANNISVTNTTVNGIYGTTSYTSGMAYHTTGGYINNAYVQTTLGRESGITNTNHSSGFVAYWYYATAAQNVIVDPTFSSLNTASQNYELTYNISNGTHLENVYLNAKSSSYKDVNADYAGISSSNVYNNYLPASRTQSTFSSFDFNNIWYWDSAKTLPVLRKITGTASSTTIGVKTVTSGTFNGKGTKAEPYLIEDVDDLYLLAYYANSSNATYNTTGKYYKLTQDLDLKGNTFTPIGVGMNPSTKVSSYAYNFRGIFDGNYHTISNAYIMGFYEYTSGLFGYIGSNSNTTPACVKNLNVININNNMPALYQGNLAGLASGLIENINISGNITSSTSSCVGGIIGQYQAINNATHFKVNKVQFSGNIYGYGSYMGGIIGYIGRSNSNLTFELSNSIFNGFMWSAMSCVGGLVGTTAASTTNTDTVLIKDSATIGTIISRTDSSITGGIIGQACSVTLANCYNSADIYVSTHTSDTTLKPDDVANWQNGNATRWWNVQNSAFIGELVGRFITPDTDGNAVNSSYFNTDKKIRWIINGTNSDEVLIPALGDANNPGNTVTGVSAWKRVQSSGTVTEQGAYTGSGQKKTTSELLQQATYAGFDFSANWGIYSGVAGGMASLKWYNENKVYITVGELELTLTNNYTISCEDGTVTSNNYLHQDSFGIYAYVKPGAQLTLTIVGSANTILGKIGSSNYYNPSFSYTDVAQGEYTYNYTVPSTVNDGETYRLIDMSFDINEFSVTVNNTITHSSGIAVGNNECLFIVLYNQTTNRAYYAKATGTAIVFSALQAGEYSFAVYTNAFFDISSITSTSGINWATADFYYTFSLNRDTAVDAVITLTATKTSDYWIYDITNL